MIPAVPESKLLKEEGANMDLYRYFHPHYNPRLRNVPLRLQELGELEQAATELRKAIQRAEIRTEIASVGGMRKEHFSEIISALDYVVDSLSTLNSAHPGDDIEAMKELLRERRNAPGWENWSRLLKQRLQILTQYDDVNAHTTTPTPDTEKSRSHG